MDSVRYYLALVLMMVTPGAFIFWFSVHPFIGFWRKVGPRLTFLIHYATMAVAAAGLFLIRKPLLSVEFGTNLLLIAVAVPIYILAVIVSVRRRRQLGTKALMGYPELAPERYDSKLVTAGIYSRIRHPRYVELLLFMLGYALLANYLAVYVAFLLSVVCVVVVVLLEEKELRERFGDAYIKYCARVPRFVPRFDG